jgi:hypothetical protein
MKNNIDSVIYIGKIMINKDDFDGMRFIYKLTYSDDQEISDVYFESLGGLCDFLMNECHFMTEKVVNIKADFKNELWQ